MAKHYEKKVDGLKQHLTELRDLRKSFLSVEALLDALSEKVEHRVLVPFAGSSEILFPGSLVNTGTIMVQLGNNDFALRTSKNALHTLQRRRKMAERMEEDFKKELKEAEARLESVARGEVPIPATQQPEEVITQNTVKMTPEGFLEIIEVEPAESVHAPPQSQPLVQEVIEGPPPSKRTSGAPEKAQASNPRRSLFAKEMSERS